MPLSRLSSLLLECYRMAGQLAPDAFQRSALELLRKSLPFRAAYWAIGYVDQERWHMYRGRAFGKKPGRSAIDLAFTTTDPVSGLTTSITLYRGAGERPFSDEERRFFHGAAPHLAENQGLAAIQHLLAATRTASVDVACSGVADRRGFLQVARPDFQDLLRLEWPAWSGRELPEELRGAIRGSAPTAFLGERIAVKVSRMSDVYLLQARRRRPADSLSGREREVAELLTEGHTYKEAAKRLGVAPSTVRNHISAIFAKLGVNKQSEMAAALRATD